MHRRRAPPPQLGPTGINTIEIVHSFESSANPARPVRPSPLTTHNGMPLDLLDRLRSFPLFMSAPEEFLSAVATHLRPQLHTARDYILTEGENAKAMYWLVRGAVAVTSRDGESTYAELKPGAFFGEIGILMNIPRTATIIARTRCLLVVLTKEALQRELPKFPEVERAIREEAEERLTVLYKKKREREAGAPVRIGGVKRHVDEDGDVDVQGGGAASNGLRAASQGLTPGGQWASASALGNVAVHIRQLLKELPLFANLPAENLHFLGLSATPCQYDPFTKIVRQGSQGREIYFIVRGEVEVVDDADPAQEKVKARLRRGQYFGEVAGLSLAPKRTATVRSVTYVECLVIGGDALSELWKKCPAEIRTQLETTARNRMDTDDNHDAMMLEHSSVPTITQTQTPDSMDITETLQSTTNLTITRPKSPLIPAAPTIIEHNVEPFDPDPYLPADFSAMARSTSRRGSLAPPAPQTPSSGSPTEEKPSSSPFTITPAASPGSKSKHATTPPENFTAYKKIRILAREPSRFNVGRFDDDILLQIFAHLDLPSLMRLRSVSTHWSRTLSTHPSLCQTLNLAPYNRLINDAVLIHSICPFVGHRPQTINISNCFHISDSGFTALASLCGGNTKHWTMKSVWDITAPAILDMSNRAKQLQSIDLSNCRKVSDTLLARVVGWVVPEFHPAYHQPPPQPDPANPNAPRFIAAPHPSMYPPAGTIIGLPHLNRITLSYCKHVTDRTMSHLAAHASKRLTHLDLTRCTTITDAGFQSWSMTRFPLLTSLVLADCTYLTDSSIVFLTNAAKNLHYLDLSFCCALSDTATEVLSLGCQSLRGLKLSFCGSAVSDSSLRAVGLHLLELRELSVRGCVRVTGQGVEAVVEGCGGLERLDVSQCKNLASWLEGGGRERVWESGRQVEFEVVASGVEAGVRRR